MDFQAEFSIDMESNDGFRLKSRKFHVSQSPLVSVAGAMESPGGDPVVASQKAELEAIFADVGANSRTKFCEEERGESNTFGEILKTYISVLTSQFGMVFTRQYRFHGDLLGP